MIKFSIETKETSVKSDFAEELEQGTVALAATDTSTAHRATDACDE